MAEADLEDPSSSSRPQGDLQGSSSSSRFVISLLPTMVATLSDLFRAAARSTMVVCTWLCFPSLSTRAISAILHTSVVGFLWFLIILALATDCLPLQIALYPAIACLHICTSSGQTRTQKIVSGAFLAALALLVLDISIICRCRAVTTTLCFTANTVALSSHCIRKIYPVAIRPCLQMIWELYLYPIARPAHPWFLLPVRRLSTRARSAILHVSVVGVLWFHIILALATDRIPLQIVIYPAIACLHICTSSGRTRTEKIVSAALLAALALLVVDISIICRCRAVTKTLCFTANTVALSSHCIRNIYPLAISRPRLQYYCIKIWELLQYLLPVRRLGIGGSFFFFINTNMHKKRVLLFLLHASVIAILLSNIILALLTDCLPMQIVIYPAIACLHSWASSGGTEIVVSGVFLGALALVVVFVSIGAHGLHIGIMFMANVVAISFHCVWKLYTLAQPWLHRYWRGKLYPIARPWLLQYLSTLAPAWLQMQDEEIGRLLLQQGRRAAAAFPMREFSYHELRAMTQDFRSMVGQGGFAQVFRGVILDDDGTGTGTAVAVKRITTAITGGGDLLLADAGDDDFLREISIVSNVHHRSLVRLLGYCLPREEGLGSSSSRYLVYPFFDNGSLDSWLFHGTQERRRLLPWPTRRCIAVDVAKALAYLHHECWQQILHLDVKPGNILLDGDLRAHISDFGISMSITRDMSSVDTRGRGTPGYMAPEMLVNAVSAKSDVFSYGMTLLELVGGRRNFDPAATDDDESATPDFTRDFFPYIVRDKMARGEVMDAVDAAMALVDREEVEAVVKVALCCIQSRWDMRPTMLTVVDMLEGRVAADLPLQSRRLSTVNFSDLLLSSSSSLTHGR